MRTRIVTVLCALALAACGGSEEAPPRGAGASGGDGAPGGSGGPGGSTGAGMGAGGMMAGGSGGSDAMITGGTAGQGTAGTAGVGAGGSGGMPGSGATFVADAEGYVVMEMESVAIPSGHEWTERTNLSGYTGSGYYRFTGNGICNGPAGSPLRYEFEILESGRYELRLRAAKIAHCVQGEPEGNGNCSESDRTCTSLGEPSGNSCGSPDECIRTDISNDAFVHLEDARGDYVRFFDQPEGSVGDPVKLFGGQSNAWAWTGRSALDPGGPKKNAWWDLDPGVYTLVVQGRSQSFRIDRMIFFDVETGSTSGAVDRPETR